MTTHLRLSCYCGYDEHAQKTKKKGWENKKFT
jgi:hypothetical protein